MILGILIELCLYKSGEMRAKHAGFMCRVSGTVISDCWVLS